jgi:hypothetical protein
MRISDARLGCGMESGVWRLASALGLGVGGIRAGSVRACKQIRPLATGGVGMSARYACCGREY